jgi:hypothetical protein
MADPSIMFAQPNAGAAFAQAFQQGMAQNQERAKRQAMAALMADPNNGQAMNALAQMDPQAAMQFKSQQAESLKAQLAQHQDSIVKGAEIIRQFQPKDQASYSQALQAAQMAGVDISQVPQEYNPQYVDGVVKLADALKPQTGMQDPGIIREFDIATQRGLVPPGTTYEQYVQLRSPSVNTPVTIPYNSTVTGGGGMPTVSSPAEAMKLPPGTQFRMPDGRIGTVPGGAGGNASGGFPQ